MKISNHTHDYFANICRRKRHEFFLYLTQRLNKPYTLLDVGGIPQYWENVKFEPTPDIKIVLFNLETQKNIGRGFEFIQGDAREMNQFSDAEFDLVFSNATISSLSNYKDQIKMASEIRRVGKRYIVQTPNRNFPVHYTFNIPFFHFLPTNVQQTLLVKFRRGLLEGSSNKKAAFKRLSKDRPLIIKEVRQCFPEACLYRENFFLFTKSFIAYYGVEWNQKDSFFR
jgi:hypothetical protein